MNDKVGFAKVMLFHNQILIAFNVLVGASAATLAFVSTSKCSNWKSNRGALLRESFLPRMSTTLTTNEGGDLPSTDEINTSPTIGEKRTMIPLSEQPLLLVSSKPLLSREECKIVIKYLEMTKDGTRDPLNDVFFERDGNYVFSTVHESKIDEESKKSVEIENNNDAMYEKARNIIYRVRSEIDRLTNSKSHSDDFALPRFLSFKVEPIPDPSKDGVQQTLHSLLPDGLHSDNVNNMYTRHISALLYLSDEVDEYDYKENGLVGGSTTFPLALPLQQNVKDKTSFDSRVEEASMKLIQKNVLHTGQRNFENGEVECTLLESAAYSVFHRDIIRKSQYCNDNVPKIDLPESTRGIRVSPKPGQLCMFHNLLDDGSPDPFSFHAGEAILGRSGATSSTGKKVLLVFFKTIPLDEPLDGDVVDLALKSKASRDWIKDQYYS